MFSSNPNVVDSHFQKSDQDSNPSLIEAELKTRNQVANIRLNYGGFFVDPAILGYLVELSKYNVSIDDYTIIESTLYQLKRYGDIKIPTLVDCGYYNYMSSFKNEKLSVGGYNYLSQYWFSLYFINMINSDYGFLLLDDYNLPGYGSFDNTTFFRFDDIEEGIIEICSYKSIDDVFRGYVKFLAINNHDVYEKLYNTNIDFRKKSDLIFTKVENSDG